MLTAISRYGARGVPNTQQIIRECRERGELVQGPQIQEFENAFARRLEIGHAVSASYGRMAFYYVLKALHFAPGSEVILPALTFWVVPEMVRVAGLKPVFVDVDPSTFLIRAEAVQKAITPRTVAIAPTHLYGLPCDMEAILHIAEHHGLTVIEDCAHALGAFYRGRPVGTFGHAAFFSFQTLKPLNTYGGGMAVMHDPQLAQRVRELAESEPWPTERAVRKRLLLGRLQRLFIRPRVFTFTVFPILWAASWTKLSLDVYLWEAIRPLNPLPAVYRERYSNVQAALGMAGLQFLDDWNRCTQEHARTLSHALRDLPGVQLPSLPPDRTHVYYQYCLYVPDRDRLLKYCIRRGLDLEMLHVDLCTRLPLFSQSNHHMPGAEQASTALQVPVYASLTHEQVRRIGRLVRQGVLRQASRLVPTTAESER